jgi:crotonobetainyl-CoA:carnitine CoA-transferase CaiB-like acyl-CoA transferase
LYRIYDANDGWIFLAAPSPAEWSDLVIALRDRIDLGSDARFATPELRAENDTVLAELLAGVFAVGDSAAWERELLAADVGCVAVSTERIERFFQSDDVGKPSGYVTEVTHPTFDTHLRLNSLVGFSRSQSQALPGVLAGSSTDAILREFGYDEAAIDALRTEQIVAG